MFQIKDFLSIVASQINHARSVTTKVTDFQPGSVVRTIIEAPAVEIEELYLQMFLGLRDAIPVATFLSFGFERLPPGTAFGYVSISATPAPAAPIEILAGTVFTATDGRAYLSTADVTWAAGSSIVSVPVLSAVTGAIGDAAAGAITASPSFGDGYVISNAAIYSGRDLESDTEREARFAEYIQSLSRGTAMACLYAAKQAVVLDALGNAAEYVTRTGLYEGGGNVSIYIYSSQGVPSAALLADGQRWLDGWTDEVTGVVTPGYRSAGVRVSALPMLERAVPLSIRVNMLPGFTLTSAVTQQIGDIFSAAVRGVQPEKTLYLGTLIESMLVVTGVFSIVPTTSENIYCAVDEALTPGALTVTAL